MSLGDEIREQAAVVTRVEGELHTSYQTLLTQYSNIEWASFAGSLALAEIKKLVSSVSAAQMETGDLASDLRELARRADTMNEEDPIACMRAPEPATSCMRADNSKAAA